ncbi:hypothetical protein BJ986_001792 [Phycicoccus badiiscoriae]|uniref:Uncharacterized protein n=1 Tax=Pedococcus badiiscoriae TaxID=642776 RepID=A0A852WM46_9MICO|nr:hypothetical protein [Pedococcus badiiscoriae]NYG07305.1 hypothetical protein [Pedococcus badiiscoriae]
MGSLSGGRFLSVAWVVAVYLTATTLWDVWGLDPRATVGSRALHAMGAVVAAGLASWRSAVALQRRRTAAGSTD